MKFKLAEICNIVKGKTGITKAIEGKYPLVTTAEKRGSHNEYQFDCKAVCVPLVSATGHGHASIKRIHYQEGRFAIGTILAAVIPKDEKIIDAKYLHIYLSYFKDKILVPLMKGSANVSLTIKSLGMAEIYVPNIEIQKRIINIISKVELEKEKVDKTIENQMILVSNLKKEILNLAVKGELIAQDPTDEPANVLLEKIKKEKEKLIKKEKSLVEITNGEKRRDLKNGWVWARIGNLGLTQTGTTPSTKKSEFFNGNVPFIKPADLSTSGINYKNESLTQLGLENGRLIKKNSVMMVCIGGSIGKCYYTDRDASCNQQINTITPLGNISSKFLYYVLSSPDFYTTMINLASGSATPIINKSKWEKILVPIPPLNEQKRITKKIDLLMSLCDKLENKINNFKKNSEALMDSILNELCKY